MNEDTQILSIEGVEAAHLQLLLVEGLEEMLGDDLVEALLQCQELRLDAAQEAPVNVETNILLLGVLADCHVLAVGLQLVLDDLAVRAVLHAEGVVQHARDVVVPGYRDQEGRGLFQLFRSFPQDRKRV